MLWAFNLHLADYHLVTMSTLLSHSNQQPAKQKLQNQAKTIIRTPLQAIHSAQDQTQLSNSEYPQPAVGKRWKKSTQKGSFAAQTKISSKITLFFAYMQVNRKIFLQEDKKSRHAATF